MSSRQFKEDIGLLVDEFPRIAQYAFMLGSDKNAAHYLDIRVFIVVSLL